MIQTILHSTLQINKTQVWRERCFLLITVPGFNLFKVHLTRLSLLFWGSTVHHRPRPGAQAALEGRLVQHAEAGVDAIFQKASYPHMAAAKDG